MKKILITMILFLVLASSCSPPEKEATQEKKPVPVDVMTAGKVDLPLVTESVGRLAPNHEVIIAAEVGGKVLKYYCDLGDKVKAGQSIADIDPVDYRLALKEAEASLSVAMARLDAATKSFKRTSDLLPRNVISPDTFDKTEEHYNTCLASVEQVKAYINISKERLKKTRIKAPFDGLIAARMVEVGQTVGLGAPLFQLVALNPVRVKIFLPEEEYLLLDRDDPVTVRLEAARDKEFKGSIDRIDIKADERTNTFGLEVLVDNPNLFLKAGMTARVSLTLDEIPGAIMIPQSTVLYREDREEIFIITKELKAELRQVKLGRSEKDMVQVREGLRQGERLVVTGGHYLNNGDRVIISSSR